MSKGVFVDVWDTLFFGERGNTKLNVFLFDILELACKSGFKDISIVSKHGTPDGICGIFLSVNVSENDIKKYCLADKADFVGEMLELLIDDKTPEDQNLKAKIYIDSRNLNTDEIYKLEQVEGFPKGIIDIVKKKYQNCYNM